MSHPPLTVTVFPDTSRQWRWHATAENGQIVAISGEGYVNRGHAERMARELFPDATFHQDDEV